MKSNALPSRHAFLSNLDPLALPLSLVLISVPVSSLGAEAGKPYRLSEALGLADNVRLGLTHRSRYETLTNNVRLNSSRNDQQLALQTALTAGVKFDGFSANFELMDSRAELTDSGSLVNNGVVNSLELLQANLQFDLPGEFGNATHKLLLGRYTLDEGGRRFIARNRTRNALNHFDGIDLTSRWESGATLHSFYSRPVRRLPSDLPSLLDNEYELDESSEATQFLGLHLSLPEFFARLNSEVYWYDLLEKDTGDVKTRNRRLQTVGVRLTRSPSRGQYDFELESVLQTGHQHGSTSPLDTRSLDHLATFNYLGLGYSFEDSRRSRVLLELDYASGDEDPLDGDSNRFDSLYGVTTIAFGPIGLYGVFSRSNIISPGIRLTTNLTPAVNLMASYRHFWLESDTDSWGSTGLRDATGAEDSYLGQHLELRLRWNVVPGNLQLEFSTIYLDANGLSDRNSRYAHVAAIVTF